MNRPKLLCVEATGMIQRFFIALAHAFGDAAEVIFFNRRPEDRNRANANGLRVVPELRRKSGSAAAEISTEAMERMIRRDRLVLGRSADEARVSSLLRRRARHDYLASADCLGGGEYAGVLVWNGEFTSQQAAIAAATEQETPVVYFENGYVGRSLQIDQNGVNCSNSLSGRPAAFYESVDVDENRLEEACARLREGKPAFPGPNGFDGVREATFAKKVLARMHRRVIAPWAEPELYVGNSRPRHAWRRAVARRRSLAPDRTELPERYVFLPLQVRDDTQLLFNSPWIRHPAEAVDVCVEALREVDPGLRLVVKEHPQDLFWVDYSEARQKHPAVIWLQKYDIQEILSKAEIVVTVNSSVGYQALVHGKSVITLGEAFYNVPGLVVSPRDAAGLAAAIAASLETPLPSRLLSQFLYHSLFEYFVPGSWRGLHSQEAKAVAKTILTLCSNAGGKS